MPAEARAVNEDGACRGEIQVVVDEKGEIGHCFMASVCRDAEGGGCGKSGGVVGSIAADVVSVC